MANPSLVCILYTFFDLSFVDKPWGCQDAHKNETLADQHPNNVKSRLGTALWLLQARGRTGKHDNATMHATHMVFQEDGKIVREFCLHTLLLKTTFNLHLQSTSNVIAFMRGNPMLQQTTASCFLLFSPSSGWNWYQDIDTKTRIICARSSSKKKRNDNIEFIQVGLQRASS